MNETELDETTKKEEPGQIEQPEPTETPKIPVPQIKIRWLRFQDHFAWTHAMSILAVGMRGSGKSSLLEVMAIRFPKIVDIYSSTDNEGLCWCKPQFIEFFKSQYGREPNILLVTGKGKDVASRFDTVKIQDLTLDDFENHDVITTCYAFHANEEEYFNTLHVMTTLLWEQRTDWKDPFFYPYP